MSVEKATPSRVKVERGIYVRNTRDGKRYEIIYQDSDGKTRWETIKDGGLKEARQARADVLSKLGRGELVRPSKLTLGEYAATWLDTQPQLRQRTRDWYGVAIRLHITPKLGRLKLGDITPDDVARLVTEMQSAGYAGWTIRGVLTPLGRIFSTAVRRGLANSNPVRRLERGERPTVERREMRVLDSAEIGRLLDAAPENYCALIATAIFTGTRQGETLAVRWGDLDFDGGVVRIRKQLGRDGSLAAPKTPQAIRDVVLIPSLARILREHKARAFGIGRARPDDFVFASQAGTPLHYRNAVRRGLDKAVENAKLGVGGRPKLRWHDLRHTYASLLIAEGLNVVYVSRQLGHASPDITLRVYAHLFDRAEHAQKASDALEAGFGAVLNSRGE